MLHGNEEGLVNWPSTMPGQWSAVNTSILPNFKKPMLLDNPGKCSLQRKNTHSQKQMNKPHFFSVTSKKCNFHLQSLLSLAAILFWPHKKQSNPNGYCQMVRPPPGKTKKGWKSGSPQTTAHFFQNIPNGIVRTIWFSTRNFRFFGVNGKHPLYPVDEIWLWFCLRVLPFNVVTTSVRGLGAALDNTSLPLVIVLGHQGMQQEGALKTWRTVIYADFAWLGAWCLFCHLQICPACFMKLE